MEYFWSGDRGGKSSWSWPWKCGWYICHERNETGMTNKIIMLFWNWSLNLIVSGLFRNWKVYRNQTRIGDHYHQHLHLVHMPRQSNRAMNLFGLTQTLLIPKKTTNPLENTTTHDQRLVWVGTFALLFNSVFIWIQTHHTWPDLWIGLVIGIMKVAIK